MKRSPPQEKAVLKKVETAGKDMDDDKKYLTEWKYIVFIFIFAT